MEEYLRYYNLYHRIFVICLIVACIFLIISMTLFFRFKVRTIIKDLQAITKMKVGVRRGMASAALSEPRAEVTQPLVVDHHHFMIEKQIILIHAEDMI